MRKGVVGEVVEPGEVGEDAGFHFVADVGEDAGFDTGALERCGPVDHGLVGLGPEGGVGGDEVAELAGVDGFAEIFGYGLPVGDGIEGSTVIVVAMAPVGGVEGGFFGMEDLFETFPGCGIWRATEDHAVVEEDGTDGGICMSHAGVIVRDWVGRRSIRADGTEWYEVFKTNWLEPGGERFCACCERGSRDRK